MTVSSFLQTNFTTQDPAVYKAAIDGDFAVLNGIAGQFAPYASSTPNMTVNIAPGRILNVATLSTTGVQTSTTITAPSTTGYSRIDRAIISKASGGLAIVTGTASTAPTAPAITSSYLPVCQILLSTATTAINNSNITDERALYVF